MEHYRFDTETVIWNPSRTIGGRGLLTRLRHLGYCTSSFTCTVDLQVAVIRGNDNTGS